MNPKVCFLQQTQLDVCFNKVGRSDVPILPQANFTLSRGWAKITCLEIKNSMISEVFMSELYQRIRSAVEGKSALRLIVNLVSCECGWPCIPTDIRR